MHFFTLEPYTGISKVTCPACRQKKCFTRYVQTDTKEKLSDDVGICDRQIKCGYHKTPKQFFNQIEQSCPVINDRRASIEVAKPIEFLQPALSEESLRYWSANNFVQWLISLFGISDTKSICNKFFVGSAKHWCNSTVFWQVDIAGNFRQCKIMLYNMDTGKRVRKGSVVLQWNKFKSVYIKKMSDIDCTKVFGKYLTNETRNLNLSQCFFGELQLSADPHKKIGLLESEKSAIIASLLFPEYIWMATGGLQGCKWTDIDICRVLTDREITLFPDLGCYQIWLHKAKQINSKINCNIYVSDFLEKVAAEFGLKDGDDLADYLLIDHKSYRCNQSSSIPP